MSTVNTHFKASLVIHMGFFLKVYGVLVYLILSYWCWSKNIIINVAPELYLGAKSTSGARLSISHSLFDSLSLWINFHFFSLLCHCLVKLRQQNHLVRLRHQDPLYNTKHVFYKIAFLISRKPRPLQNKIGLFQWLSWVNINYNIPGTSDCACEYFSLIPKWKTQSR